MESLFMRGRVLPLVVGILSCVFGVAAQTQPSCSTNAAAPVVHAEGLAERVSDITLTCTGGIASSTANLSLFITLNTNITNRIDSNGNLQGISVTVNTGAGQIPSGTIQGYAGSAVFTTLFIGNLIYTVPLVPATPVIITISGLRAAVALTSSGTSVPVVTATVAGIGAQLLTTVPVPVAASSQTLLTSLINNGIPCFGSPLPATLDFPGFIAVNAVSSTIRLSESSPAGFTARDPTGDTGLRIRINLSGYSAGSRVFVPDAIVGSTGTTPTSAGAFGTTVTSGTFQPGSNQLLFIRVNGSDANGAGGQTVLGLPVLQTTYTSMSEIALNGGSASIVYEVVSSNQGVAETAQVPIFVVAPQIACGAIGVVLPAITANLAPVSTVSVPSATDPIPRFTGVAPASDCQLEGDCNASYYPKLSVDTTPINLSGASLGNRQGGTIALSNSGGGLVNFTVAVTYANSSTSFLSVAPTTGQLNSQNGASLQVLADPSNLQPGTYTATVTITGSSSTFNVPVTFTVGPPGLTISNVLNAATGTSPVAPGSYAALYGLNLAGQSVTVTFNGLAAQVIFASATQINVVVPAALGTAPAADVVVRADGKVSNSFKASLALNAPGIFNPGIENADGSVNGSGNPAAAGNFVAVYLTGLTIPLTGQITVTIGNQTNLLPSYAGAQPTLTALDQVNITIPGALAGSQSPVPLTICIPGPNGQPVCSNPANLYLK